MNTKIEEFITLLPKGYENACYETKAIKRKKTIQTPEELLVLCLSYLYGMSFLETSQLANRNAIGKISDVAFRKRFAKSKAWFQWRIAHLKPEAVIHYPKPKLLTEYHVIAVDASNVFVKGAVKQTFRFHYAVDLFSFTCNQFQLTEQSTGETLRNFHF